MGEPDWKAVAKGMLQQEKELSVFNHPKPTGVLVEWKNKLYIGSIQQIVPDYSKEIFMLSKSSSLLPDGLVKAIKEQNPERLYLHADSTLDLTGRQYVLRKLEDRLVALTPEQDQYVAKKKLRIRELPTRFSMAM
jgi:hypothetical protein